MVYNNMTPSQLEQLQKTIAVSIEKNVNGKIRLLDQKIDDYIKADELWKNSVTPSIDTMKKLDGFTSIGGTILKVIVLLGAATTAIWGAITFLKK